MKEKIPRPSKFPQLRWKSKQGDLFWLVIEITRQQIWWGLQNGPSYKRRTVVCFTMATILIIDAESQFTTVATRGANKDYNIEWSWLLRTEWSNCTPTLTDLGEQALVNAAGDFSSGFSDPLLGTPECWQPMRLHHIVGGSTGPRYSLFRFHNQRKNIARLNITSFFRPSNVVFTSDGAS